MRQKQYIKMTQTPVLKLIGMLSVPTILSMLVTSIYNMADTAFVGMVGTSASGAVGVVFGFMAILQSIGFLFGQGCGSILSRKLGARDNEGASRTASAGFFAAMAGAILIASVTWFNMDAAVRLFGATETIAPYAKDYLRCILIATPFMVPTFTMNNILRYEGKASLGAVGMMTGAMINIVGDPIFVLGFHMGITGVGLSTTISQITSFIILLSMFLRGKTQTRLSLRMALGNIREYPEICGTGMPSLLRQSLASLTTILLNLAAGPYGDAAIAAMSIVTRVSFMVFSIGLGIGQGFQPVSAFNYGAGKYRRVRKAYITTVILAEVLLVLLTMVVMIYSGNVIRIFRDDDQVVLIGTRALRLQLAAQVFLPFCMTTEMLLQTTGRKLQASILSSSRSGLFFIPALLILSNLRGLAGIQESQPVAYFLATIPAILFCRDFFRHMPKEDAAETT